MVYQYRWTITKTRTSNQYTQMSELYWYDGAGNKLDIQNINLANPNEFEDGYIDASGNWHAQSSALEKITGWISISTSNVYISHNGYSKQMSVSFYNSSKQFISQQTGQIPVGTIGSFQPPSGSAYVRYCWQTNGDPVETCVSLKNVSYIKYLGTTTIQCSTNSPSEYDEGIAHLIDNDITKKACVYFDGTNGTKITLTIDANSDPVPNTFSYVTGNDSTERDPISWKWEKSMDGGTTWELIKSESEVTSQIPTSRRAETPLFDISQIRQFRWKINRTRGNSDQIKLGEIYVYDQNGDLVDWTGVTVTTNALVSSGLSADRIIDGNDLTCCQLSNESPTIITFTKTGGFGNTIFTTFKYVTGDDHSEYDPTYWEWEMSDDDGTTWHLIDRKDNVTSQIPETRSTHTPVFTFEPPQRVKYRWTITGARGSNGYTQATELYFYDENGNQFSWTGADITCNTTFPNTQGPTSLIDGNLNTVMCLVRVNPIVITITMPEGQYVTPASFAYLTGGDEINRDPTGWTWEVSYDGGTTWTTINTITNCVSMIPLKRKELATRFNFDGFPITHFKFHITALRTTSDSYIRIGELYLLNQQKQELSLSGFTVSTGAESTSDGIQYLIDGTNHHWSAYWRSGPVDIYATTPYGYDASTICGMKYKTASDRNTGDPISWTVSKSTDNGETWTLLKTFTSVTIPTTQSAITDPFMFVTDPVYYKMHVTALRPTHGEYITMAEFYLLNNHREHIDLSQFIVTTTAGETSDPITNLIDGTTNKWTGIWDPSGVDIVFKSPATFEPSIVYGMQYMTSADSDDGEPISWDMYFSSDGVDWTLLKSFNNVKIPSGENVLTNTFMFIEPVRYYKMHITKVRETSSRFVKMDEIYLLDKNQQQMSLSGFTVSTDAPSTSDPITNLIDGTTNKWTGQWSGSGCNVFLTSPEGFEAEQVFAMQYMTANDGSNGDPVSWEIYDSYDNSTWRLLATYSDVTIPTTVNTLTDVFWFTNIIQVKFRIQITDVRSDTSSNVSMSEIYFTDISKTPLDTSDFVITTDAEETEYPVTNLLDGTTSKWESPWTGECNIILQTPDGFNHSNIKGYRFKTADDSDAVPTSFSVYRSYDDGETWDLLKTFNDPIIPETDYTNTRTFLLYDGLYTYTIDSLQMEGYPSPTSVIESIGYPLDFYQMNAVYIIRDDDMRGYPCAGINTEFNEYPIPFDPNGVFGTYVINDNNMNGYPCPGYTVDYNGTPEPMGCCLNCTNLTSVTIPESVKRIGPYAFFNTKLTHVTIASDCYYYPTSFPKDCVIDHYDD